MNHALYYIAAVMCIAYSAISLLHVGTMIFLSSEIGFPIIALSVAQPLIFAFCGLLFFWKYNKERPQNQSYASAPFIEVIGILSLVVGISWFATEMSWVYQATTKTMELDSRVIEKIVPSIALIVCGVYFGFFHGKRRSIQ